MNIESAERQKARILAKTPETRGGDGVPPLQSYAAVALNDARQQLALNSCNLRFDHAVEVQLTAAREGQMFS